jgi:hypothetical protein
MPLMGVLTWMGMSSVSWTGLVAIPHSVVRLLMVFQGVPIGTAAGWGLVVAAGCTGIVTALAIAVTRHERRRGREDGKPTAIPSGSTAPMP